MPGSTKRAAYRSAIALATVGIVGFITLLTVVVVNGDVAAIDEPFFTWLLGTRTDAVTAVMTSLATIFGPVVLPIAILVVVVAWSLISRHVWRPLLLMAGMIAGLIVVQIITRVVGRERPPLDLMLLGPDTTPSFPSGHVAGAADFLLLIAYLVFSRRVGTPSAVVSYTAAVILIILAGVSRIYLGYHWPSDALASACVSMAVLGGIIALDTHRTMRVKP